MPLRPVYGLDPLLQRFRESIAAGRFPQALLLAGRPGAGKQRLGLWIAEALLCEGPEPPCGACPACRLVANLSHPDLHWLVPVPRLKATEPDKQVAEVELALAEIMAERRATGRWRAPDGAVSHPLASVRLLQRRVALTPFRGRRKVVLLGDAERMVVQDATPDAANALLKVLEEPPADTVLVLTAAEPQALLPTIRSRLVPVRVPPVSDGAVRAWLDREPDQPPAPAERDRLVRGAEGAIGRLEGAAEDTGGEADVTGLLAAVKKGDAAGWATRVLRQPPWDARGGFTDLLDALGARARKGLRERAEGGDRPGAARLARIVRRLETAREEARGNRNPQLGLATLAMDLEKLS